MIAGCSLRNRMSYLERMLKKRVSFHSIGLRLYPQMIFRLKLLRITVVFTPTVKGALVLVVSFH